MTPEMEAKILCVIQRATGLSPEKAQQMLEDAKKRLEAGALLGVAGFWS